MRFTFRAAVRAVEQHAAVLALQHNEAIVQQEGWQRSSWHDPVIKLNAKNLSHAWFKGNTTPMSGFDIGIMQKSPPDCTFINTYIKFSLLPSKAPRQPRLIASVSYLRSLWQILITERKLRAEHKILQENRVWLRKTLKVRRTTLHQWQEHSPCYPRYPDQNRRKSAPR